MLKVKNGGQRLFLGVQSVHPRLTTARIKGKPLLEKNVSTKAKTKTKTSKNTKTKTWTQTKTKTDKKSTRQHHPDLREAPILKNTLQDLIYTERQFCQMETCLKGCSTATTSLDESPSVRVIRCFFFHCHNLRVIQWLFCQTNLFLICGILTGFSTSLLIWCWDDDQCREPKKNSKTIWTGNWLYWIRQYWNLPCVFS